MKNLRSLAYLTFSLFVFSVPVISQTVSQEKSSKNLIANHHSDNVSEKKWTALHPFSRRVFVENNGQFDRDNKLPEHKLKYSTNEGGTYVYFYSTGLLFRHDKLPTLTEEEKEEIEESKGEKGEKILSKKKAITTIVNMEWLGADPETQIETEDKVSDYFYYGSIKAHAYKKIIYKNIYPHIDIEYAMLPYEIGGMKYVIVLHPGADPSVIKMKYSDDGKIKINALGDVVIRSKMDDIIDHAPQTFYKDGATIGSQFVLKDNTITFKLDAYDHSKTVVIDPTVTFHGTTTTSSTNIFGQTTYTTTNTTSDGAYDVDYDNAGNVFVYGGAPPFQVIKFNSAGTQLWTHSTKTSWIDQYGYGDFSVDPVTGRIYICEGMSTTSAGSRILKLASNGDSINMYPGDSMFHEMWRMHYNPCLGKTVIAGASWGGEGSRHAAMLDTTMATLTSVRVLPEGDDRDMAMLALDDYGNAFMAGSIPGGTDPPNDLLKLAMPTFDSVWSVKDRHDHMEYTPNSYVEISTGGYNGMAASPNYLYTYDGAKLKQWDPSNGVCTDSVILKATADFKTAGVSVDNCDNIYVGYNKTVRRYNSNLVLQQTLTATDTVFDVKLGNGVLYVSGKGFVEALTAVTCSADNINITIIPAANCGSASASVTGASPPYTYAWSTSPVQTTATATFLNSGTYTVTVTDASCAKAVATETVSITIGSASTVSVNSETICEGSAATLTASGEASYSYSWEPATGLNAVTGASVTATPTVTTTYTVTGTDGGCSGTAISTVTVDPLPVVSVNSETICSGQTATLTAVGADAYVWSGGSTTNPLSVSPANATSYTVTGTTNGCSGTAVATVAMSQALTVTATSTTVCLGVSSTLTAGGADSYVWSNGSAINTLTDAPVTSTSYTVTGTTDGCTGTAVGTINITAKDDATFSYTPSTVCKTGGSDPSPVIAGTTGGTFSCPDGALILHPSTGVITLASTPVGTYTVTYTTTGACPDSKTFVVSIVNVPNANFSFAGPYCQDAIPDPLPVFPVGSSAGVFSSSAGLVFVSTATGEVDLSASTPNTYTITNTIAAGGGCQAATAENTITINAVPVTFVDNQNTCSGNSATLTAGGATIYVWSDGSTAGTLTDSPATATSYTVTGTTAGCSSSAVGTISVFTGPTVMVNSTTICAGESGVLTASGSAGYTWSDGTSGNSLTDNPATTTSYTVTGLSPNCPATLGVGTITVIPTPTVTVNSPVICTGLSATLTASGASNYSWSDASSVNPKTVTPSATTSYIVVGTTSGCSASAVSTVTVTQLPVITVNSTTICSGQTSTLTAGGGSSYAWSTGASGNSITVSPTATTSYTVSDNTPGCSGSATGTITVNIPPIVTVNAATICEGQSATLIASGANNYAWSTGSVNNPLVVSPTASTTYTVTGDPGGCSGSTITIVTVNPNPVVIATSASVCQGVSTTLTALGANTYIWSNGGITPTISVSSSATTSYIVTGATVAGCTGTAIGTVTVFPTPQVDFTFDPKAAGVLNPVITFDEETSADVNYWSWSFGDGELLAPDTRDPVHTYPALEATYTVTLDVMNAGLCINSVSHNIVISSEFTFFIPNAFSPNDDQKNDVFGGSGSGILTFQLFVFDRWGNLIFSADDISKTWDGKPKDGSEVALQDVFVWTVTLKDVFKKEHSFIGTVTIVK